MDAQKSRENNVKDEGEAQMYDVAHRDFLRGSSVLIQAIICTRLPKFRPSQIIQPFAGSSGRILKSNDLPFYVPQTYSSRRNMFSFVCRNWPWFSLDFAVHVLLVEGGQTPTTFNRRNTYRLNEAGESHIKVQSYGIHGGWTVGSKLSYLLISAPRPAARVHRCASAINRRYHHDHSHWHNAKRTEKARLKSILLPRSS